MPNVTQQSRAAQYQFELVLRLQQSWSSQPEEGIAGLRLRAQALAKDILMSRLEVNSVVDAQEYVYTQGFNDLGKALATSRALQVAFEGFRRAVPSGRTNVSVVLDSSAPEEASSAQVSPSIELRDLLASAKPSQVLITQAFYDKVSHCQPLALRSFPPRARVYEFLWTNEERLDELQAETVFMPTLVSDRALPAAAVNTVSEQTDLAAIERRPKDEIRPRTFQEHASPDDQAFTQGLSRRLIIAISSAAAILIIIGYLVIAHGFIGHRPKQVGRSLLPGARTPAPTQSPLPAPKAPPPTPRAPELSKEPTHPVVTTTPGPRGSNPSLPDRVLKSVPRVRECPIGANLIPNYLQLAESNRISGQYDAAMREYNEVLVCEPGNRAALDGRQRTIDAERLR